MYSTRTQAANAAQRKNLASFITHQGNDLLWQFTSTYGDTIEAAELWAADKDYVAWVEECPDGLLYAVVTCFKHEIDDEIPTYINLKPLTPSLWDGDKGHVALTGMGPAPVSRATQSGPVIYKRPRPGGKTTRVWELADEMPNATRNEIIDACLAEGLNRNMTVTQYGRWKKLNLK